MIRLHKIDKKSGSLSQKELCRDLKHVCDFIFAMLRHFSHVWLFATPPTPHNPCLMAPLSMGFSRQE